MTILITLVLPPGGDAGPFNLFSNTDGYVTPFATNVSAAALIAGYTALLVPDGTTIIKVQSVGVCTNFVNVPVNVLPTTTTTSSSSTSTTSSTSSSSTSTTTSSSSSSTSTSTSTSTSSSTTTTTTTCACVDYNVVIGPIDIAASIVDVQYVNCAGDTTTTSSDVVTTFTVCVKSGNIPLIYRETPPTSVVDSSITITSNCCTSPTTSTTTTGV